MTTVDNIPAVTDTHRYYAGHAWWCAESEVPHDDDMPYCNQMVGGVEGVVDQVSETTPVPEPDEWQKAQVWVHFIHSALNGEYPTDQWVAANKHRGGVQLAVLVYDESTRNWSETLINIGFSAARTLAAQLIHAADVNELARVKGLVTR